VYQRTLLILIAGQKVGIIVRHMYIYIKCTLTSSVIIIPAGYFYKTDLAGP